MASLGEPTKKTRRKRQVLTAEDKARNKRKAEDARWTAAKTYDAKAWINPTRLLKEVFSGEEDVLVLKVGQATRREICFKSESMNLHYEQLNTQPDADASPDCWVVIGRNRMTVAGKVRDIQRQSQRSNQLAQDREAEEEADGLESQVDDEEDFEAEEGEADHELNLDPRLGGTTLSQQEEAHDEFPKVDTKPLVREHHVRDEKPAPQAHMYQEADLVAPSTDNDRYDGKQHGGENDTSQQTNHDAVDDRVIDEESSNAALHGQEESAMNAQNHQHPPTETEEKQDVKVADVESNGQDEPDGTQGKDYDGPPLDTDDDRTAHWVTKHSAPYRSPSPESLDPTGKWLITSEGITEKYGQESHLHLSIYVTPTRPQNDNDTDDGLSDPIDEENFQYNKADDDVDDADLTPEQLQRKGTYQMWATFTFGLYHGIMRFLPSTAVATPHKRSIFDLQPHQLPSVLNTTFQYKWRGRDTTDDEINTEAENATQWVKFEDSGIGLTGMFESDVLGENRFEGRKVGVCKGSGGKLGRLWSEISAKAYEFEKKMGGQAFS